LTHCCPTAVGAEMKERARQNQDGRKADNRSGARGGSDHCFIDPLLHFPPARSLRAACCKSAKEPQNWMTYYRRLLRPRFQSNRQINTHERAHVTREVGVPDRGHGQVEATTWWWTRPLFAAQDDRAPSRSTRATGRPIWMYQRQIQGDICPSLVRGIRG